MSEDKTYNGWVGRGTKISAHATWNLSLWVSNDEGFHFCKIAWLQGLDTPPTGEQVCEFISYVFDEAGWPADFSEWDRNQVCYEEIAESWVDDWREALDGV